MMPGWTSGVLFEHSGNNIDPIPDMRASSRVPLHLSTLLLSAGLVLSCVADWPQWRGPDRTDLSKEKGLLKTWPDGGPKRVWLFDKAGLGYSGPAIVRGTLYTMGARDSVEQLIALEAATGKELWSAKVGELLKNGWGDGPRGTPCVDGDRVYALSGKGDLVCANAKDGKILWQRTLQEFGGGVPSWGYSESVLVDGNLVICTPGGSKGTILALNKTTGEPVWQSKDFTDPAHYASAIVVDHGGQRQVIQLTEKHIAGVSVADGKVLWTSEFPGRTAVIPTPIFSDGMVYVSAGYEVGCKMIKLGSANEVTEGYANKEMVNHHGGVILLDGHLYGYSDRLGWVCQNLKSGEKVWAEKAALGKGAIAYADGMFYCLAEQDGTLALVEASAAGWKERSRFKLDPQTTQRSPRGRIWTHPVISGGRLYLRDQELLSCYDVKAP
jgi:outer membrane protein assembly factor BamB